MESKAQTTPRNGLNTNEKNSTLPRFNGLFPYARQTSAQVDENKTGAWYMYFWNTTLKNIGNGNTVEIFDGNRLYTAVGYSITDNLKVQAGYMRQSTNALDKGQLQLSLHHTL